MQQLLLIVLASIIVAAAVILGMEYYRDGAVESNKSGITQELLVIASRAQTWYHTPATLGGGERSFVKLSFAAINCDSVTIYGTYELSELAPSSFELTGTSAGDQFLQLTMQVSPVDVEISQ